MRDPLAVTFTLVWIAISTLLFLHLYIIRKCPSVEKRKIILLASCIALDSVSGAIGILRIFGTLTTTPYIFFRLLIFFAWVPAWNFLLFLRMLLFMESGARNYGYLKAMRSVSNSGEIPQLSQGSVELNRFDRLVLRVLGFQNIVVSIGNVHADKYKFGALQLVRAIGLNILMYGASLAIVIGATLLAKADLMDQFRHKNSAIWITSAALTILFQIYLIYFLSRLRHIKDHYGIRAELGLLVLLFTAIIMFVLFDMSRGNLMDMANEPAKALSLVFVSVVTTFILYVSTITAYLLNKRQADHVKMTFAEFEVALSDAAFLKQLKPQMALDFCIENALFIREYESLVEMSARLAASADKEEPTPRTAEFVNATNSLPSPVTLNSAPEISNLSKSGSLCSHATQFNVLAAKNTADELRAAVDLATKKLFFDFVVEGAVHELNLPHNVRNVVTKQLFSKELSWKDFASVRREVAMSIYQNSYPQFVRKNQGIYELKNAGQRNT